LPPTTYRGIHNFASRTTIVDYLIMHIFMQHAQGVPFKGSTSIFGILQLG